MSRSNIFLFTYWLCAIYVLFPITDMAQPLKSGFDTASMNKLITAAKTTRNSDTAILILNKVITACADANDYNRAAIGCTEISGHYFDKGDLEKAEDYIQKGLVYAEKSCNKARIASCFIGLGNIYSTRGNFVEATKAYFKALENLNQSSDLDGEITVYNDLAAMSQQSGDDSKELYYLDQAQQRAITSKLPNERSAIHLGSILINKGSYYINHNNPDSAIYFYRQALDVAEKISSMQEAAQVRLKVYSLGNLSSLFLETKAYATAEIYARKTLLLAHGKYPVVENATSYSLGQALTYLKRYKEAELILLSALSRDHAMNTFDQMATGYYALYKLYAEMGKYKKAMLFQDSLIAMKDTLKSIENLTAIKKIEAKYELAKKDKQIISNELQIAHQKNKITRKNIWIGSILTLVALSVIFSALFYRSNRRKHVTIIKTLKQENTISILKGVIQGEENERIRIARELHDGIGSMFTAIKMCFAALRQENAEISHSQKYMNAVNLLQKTADEIRKTSHNMMPEVLLHQDLAEAVKNYCIHLRQGTSLLINVETSGNLEQISDDLKLNIYRIIQELLKNIVDHAHATQVIVQILQNANHITITVEDNGTGFDNKNTSNGIGLFNLKTRVISYDGHLVIQSEKGKGTTVIVEFPLSMTGRQKVTFLENV